MAGLDSSRFAEKQSASAAAAAAPGYGVAAYWLSRYTSTSFEAYDWYLKWDQLKETISPLITPESQILIVGCGTSQLGEKLYDAGFINVTNVDICVPLIDDLQAKVPESKATLKYEASPVHLLPKDYPSWLHTFDLVIDKAMLDSLACGKDKAKETKAALTAISVLLKKEGTLVSLSHMRPELRQPMFVGDSPPVTSEGDGPAQLGESSLYRWKVTHRTLPRPMAPVADVSSDPKAKAAAPAKGEAKVEMLPSTSFNAKDHVYHVYACTRL